MLEAVSQKGFKGQVVKDAVFALKTEGKVRRELARLPEDLRKEVQKAKQSGKPLLLAFHGPGCPPCKRMDAVTYPDDRVKQELTNWVVLRVDVEERTAVAEVFEVEGIPVAVAVTADGEELGRVQGFVEPGEFYKQLEARRQRAGR